MGEFCQFFSQDFATSSLKGEVAVENEHKKVIKELEVYEIATRKQWEQRYVPTCAVYLEFECAD